MTTGFEVGDGVRTVLRNYIFVVPRHQNEDKKQYVKILIYITEKRKNTCIRIKKNKINKTVKK